MDFRKFANITLYSIYKYIFQYSDPQKKNVYFSSNIHQKSTNHGSILLLTDMSVLLLVFEDVSVLSALTVPRGALQKRTKNSIDTHSIHVWYISLHLPYKSTIHVGKYTSPMDDMGLCKVYS